MASCEKFERLDARSKSGQPKMAAILLCGADFAETCLPKGHRLPQWLLSRSRFLASIMRFSDDGALVEFMPFTDGSLPQIQDSPALFPLDLNCAWSLTSSPPSVQHPQHSLISMLLANVNSEFDASY